ncbi:MAG: hypothetical protein AB7Y46_01440 [Armatimonadota bacterium]
MSASSSEIVGIAVERRQQRLAIATAVGAAMVAIVTMLMLGYDGTVGLVFPLALVLTWVMLYRPWVLYTVALAQFSILPVEGHVRGAFIPNINQFLVPALFVAILATSAAKQRWGTFRVRAADVFVAGFLVVAVLGIQFEPGYKNWKMFVNQIMFAVLLYFATAWLELDRARFRSTLKWVLLAAGFMLADLAMVQLFGIGRIWTKAGPLGSLSDQATYSALFPPLFLYVAATVSGPKAQRDRWFWLALAVLGTVAAAGVKERSGVIAALAGMLVCIVHPRMFRWVAVGAVALIPIGAWWLSTNVGSEVRSRFTDDEDPMLRRRIYLGKAIDYINSEHWNPIWGTGFWRLERLSNQMLSTAEVVWYPNRMSWRSEWELGRRPIHCAPVTIFGEYGYGGVTCLAGLLICAVTSVALARARARRTGRGFDSTFLVAVGGTAVSLLINALFHNTEQVFPVTALWWAFMGLMVAHADVLIIPREDGEKERPSNGNFRDQVAG